MAGFNKAEDTRRRAEAEEKTLTELSAQYSWQYIEGEMSRLGAEDVERALRSLACPTGAKE